jgi:thiol-disulfide isomerase/thioredoxin
MSSHHNASLIELTASDFTNYLNGPLANRAGTKQRGSISSLVMVYASWCGHCQSYLQSGIPEQLAELLANSGRQGDLVLAKFEGSSLPEHRKVASEFFGINAFPTFIFVHVDKERGAKLKWDLMSDSVPRSASAQFQALLDFDTKMRTSGQEQSDTTIRTNGQARPVQQIQPTPSKQSQKKQWAENPALGG